MAGDEAPNPPFETHNLADTKKFYQTFLEHWPPFKNPAFAIDYINLLQAPRAWLIRHWA